MSSAANASSGIVFPYEARARYLEALSRSFREALPFPHAVIEDFLNADLLRRASAEFEEQGKDWIPYVHLNENKRGRSDYRSFGPAMRSIVDEMGSPRFIEFLRGLTGLDGLFLDKELIGGGFHATERGGYLNIHTDFTAHPYHGDWERAINLLIYVNDGWKDEYGGALELWEPDMSAARVKAAPHFNRAVIFRCGEKSFHGYPDPIRCPDGVIRKSIALYFYRVLPARGKIRPTSYRARPVDPFWKRLLIRSENILLALYHRARMRLKFSDRSGGRIASFFRVP